MSNMAENNSAEKDHALSHSVNDGSKILPANNQSNNEHTVVADDDSLLPSQTIAISEEVRIT